MRGTSDTEILLEYLASNMKKGLDLDALLNNLNGIFAFVVYDFGGEQMLVCSRSYWHKTIVLSYGRRGGVLL